MCRTKRGALKTSGVLRFKGISTGIHYPIALPNLRAYTDLNHNENDFPEASKASEEILSLPMFPELKRWWKYNLLLIKLKNSSIENREVV